MTQPETLNYVFWEIEVKVLGEIVKLQNNVG